MILSINPFIVLAGILLTTQALHLTLVCKDPAGSPLSREEAEKLSVKAEAPDGNL